MKVRNTALPASRVAIDTIGEKTTVSLWDGTYTVHAAAVDPEMGEQSTVEYEYSLYQMPVRLRPGMAESIEANFGDWYAAAAERETAEANARSAAVMEREISGHLMDTLLDYDFRLMMLEELGGTI